MHNRKVCAVKNARVSQAVQVLILASVAACFANGQQRLMQSPKQSYAADPASLPIAISKLEKGNFELVDIEIIARWHAVKAIPQLESQFDQSKDPETKAKIANALVRLGKKDGPYWDFLIDRARQVLQDESPTPIDYDTTGKALPKPSKELTEWANKHHVSVQEALANAMFYSPGVIMDLGSSDDDRAVPILRKALASENHFIEAEAARGLAEMRDSESVPEIIHACKNAPKEAAALIAQPLVYFDDPVAQRAVDAYVPENIAQSLRQARVHGKTPYR